MVKRQLAQREVLDVYMPQTNAMGEVANALGAFGGLASTYADVKQKEDQLKMNDFLADANIQALKTTQQWKIDNEGDPFNPDKVKELDREYDKIFAGYNGKLSSFSRGQWIQARDKVKNKYSTNNAEWGVKQIVKNAQTSLNNGIEKANQAAFLMGMQGDSGNASESYKEQKDAIIAGATGLLPESVINESISNFKSDFTKNYIQGLIRLDPAKAEEILKDPQTLKDIDSAEAVDLLDKMVARQTKQNKADLLENQKTTENGLANKLIEDPDSVSLGDIQRMEMLGEIRPARSDKFQKYKTGAVFSATSDPATYNRITNLLTGEERKKDGSLYDVEDISAEILGSASKLTKADSNALSKSFPEKRKTLRQNTQKQAENSLKQTLEKSFRSYLNMPGDDGKLLKGKYQGKIDDIIFNFNKQILSENASPERIKEIETEFKIMNWKEIDPEFNYDGSIKIDAYIEFKEGEFIYNIDTGAVKRMSKNRTWADQ